MVMALSLLYAYCSLQQLNFLARSWETGHIRIFEFTISLVPVVLAYTFCRLLFGALASVVVVGLALTSISYASHMKYALTMQPISWNDIWNLSNMSVVFAYFDASIIVCATLCFAIIFVAAVFIDVKMGTYHCGKMRAISTALAVVTLVLLATNSTVSNSLSRSLSVLAANVELDYLEYDWNQNLSLNGLTLHLIQTSVRKIPEPATTEEITAFQKLKVSSDIGSEMSPRTIITILCEACWNNERHFSEYFEPLNQYGFARLRGVSPVYGGGTVNAEYEMLTGLPSEATALSGIIYQEYTEAISSDAFTIASLLREEGYRTVALHNHDRRFWRRDVVLPKLGFESFIGLEDMAGKREGWWADDKMLFDAALDVIRKDKDRPIYLSLSTVYTHGSYPGSGIDGVDLYRSRLQRTMQVMSDFVGSVLTTNPDATILIYGDHKPQLTRWFAENGVLPPNTFTFIGEHPMDVEFSPSASRDLLGDVPIYVLSSDSEARQRFLSLANGKPFFCVSGYLATELLGVSTPAHRFGRRPCDDYRPGWYPEIVSSYPAWLVSLSVLGR